jgi:hypothetical protein
MMSGAGMESMAREADDLTVRMTMVSCLSWALVVAGLLSLGTIGRGLRDVHALGGFLAELGISWTIGTVILRRAIFMRVGRIGLTRPIWGTVVAWSEVASVRPAAPAWFGLEVKLSSGDH